MKTKLLLPIFCLCLNTYIQAQDLVIHVDKKGRVGFVDKNGAEVIKCQYDSANPFKNGVSIVMKSDKYGMIDTTGKIVLPLKYSQIHKWGTSRYIIKSGKVYGLVDLSGNIVLSPAYSQISKPNCYGKALITVGGSAAQYEKKTYMQNAKYGIIDRNGNILVQPIYKGLYEFTYNGSTVTAYKEGMRLAYNYHFTTDTLVTDCSFLGYSNTSANIYGSGIIDGNGNILVKSGLYSFVMMPKEGMVRYYNIKNNETICGYHNIANGTSFQTGDFPCHIDKMTVWSHGDFHDGMAPANNGTTWSFVDKNGQTLKSGYKSIIHGNAVHLWAARKSDNKWDVFDEKNNSIASLSGYDDIKFQKNEDDKELYMVKKDGKYGGISRDGTEQIPFDYELATGKTYDVIMVRKDGKWGAVNTDNKLIIPNEFIDIIMPTRRSMEHFWVRKADSLYYHYNSTLQKLSDKGYKVVFNFEDELAFVQPAGMTVKDTPINRAMLFPPNTKAATIAAAKLEEHVNAYVYIINSDDEMVFDEPVSSIYMNAIMKEAKKYGGRILTDHEKKNVLLDVTSSNRSYDLKATLGEEEWNY